MLFAPTGDFLVFFRRDIDPDRSETPILVLIVNFLSFRKFGVAVYAAREEEAHKGCLACEILKRFGRAIERLQLERLEFVCRVNAAL